MTKISVCVPIYGVEGRVGRCARSLFSQSMTDGVEFIFVDDASPDGSVAELRGVVARYAVGLDVKLLRHDVNKGVPEARRTAVLAAKGDFVAHVDSDDFVDAGYLESLYAAAMSSGADVIFSDMREEYARGGKTIHSSWAQGFADLGIAALLGHDSTYLWGKLIRRDLYVRHPECHAPSCLRVKEDCYSAVRLCHHSKALAHAGVCLYHYDRSVPQSLTRARVDSQFQAMLWLWGQTRAFYAAAYPDGRYTPALESAMVREKAAMMLFRHDFAAKRKYADVFRDEEGRHMRELRGGLRLMLTLVRHHFLPLVWLYTQYAKWREKNQ